MKNERPIIFSTENVRAILDGRKTQTRRVAKLPDKWHRGKASFKCNPHGDEEYVIHGDCGIKNTFCPHGRVGDRLWVKETWSLVKDAKVPFYKATDGITCGSVWRPSIHMPKELARIWLEITNIRVERVQDISLSDIGMEGIFYDSKEGRGHLREKFQTLWDSINKKRGFGWDTNPWVWVIEFKRIKSSVDSVNSVVGNNE